MNEYDIEKAFTAIEEELIASMMRNMQRHKDWETEEGFRWTMWQAEQLKALEKYKRQNKKKFQRRFNEINGSIKMLVEQARQAGGLDQELEILEAIEQGWKLPKARMEAGEISSAFFALNTRKLNALIKATESDFAKAETAMLRMAEDQYRQVIFNAQVYANTGAGTYEKAVDMATRDFLSRGINCIEYANGARHRIKDYAMMAIRTASKRAYLTGEGEKRQEWGISTVIMNKRGNPCPKCLPFVGKILIDDVWSGGSAEDGPYPLMSSAVAAGLYHPNCKDSHSTYFEGISTPPDDKFTEEEIEQIEQDYSLEQKKSVAKRNYEKYSRLEEHSLDEENKAKYAARKTEWYQKYKAYYQQGTNARRDKEQFGRYQKILQELCPGTLEEFADIKYNDAIKWNQIKYQYRTLNRYEVEGKITATEILELDNAAWYTKQLGFKFETLSGDHRKEVKGMRRSGNAAVLKTEDGKIRFAHSRANSKIEPTVEMYEGEYDLVLLKEKRQFEVLDLGDGVPRQVDTEAKFFEMLANSMDKGSKERIVLLSEKHMCKSCRHVMEQFQVKFPKVEIVLIHGKRGYNNSKDGLNTWKYRKKVKQENEKG